MADSRELKFNTDVMLEVVREIEDQRAILRDCFENIREEALRLRGNHWEGSSNEAYHSKMNKLSTQEASSSDRQNAGYVLNTLSAYIKDLTAIATEYGATEQKIIDRYDALPTDVFDI